MIVAFAVAVIAYLFICHQLSVSPVFLLDLSLLSNLPPLTHGEILKFGVLADVTPQLVDLLLMESLTSRQEVSATSFDSVINVELRVPEIVVFKIVFHFLDCLQLGMALVMGDDSFDAVHEFMLQLVLELVVFAI